MLHGTPPGSEGQRHACIAFADVRTVPCPFKPVEPTAALNEYRQPLTTSANRSSAAEALYPRGPLGGGHARDVRCPCPDLWARFPPSEGAAGVLDAIFSSRQAVNSVGVSKSLGRNPAPRRNADRSAQSTIATRL